jgi:hypothetical protein
MRRLFWLGVGAAVGALVVRKVTKTVQAYSPRGLASSAQSSAAGFFESLRAFVDEVRTATAAREQELHRELEQRDPGSAA